MNEIPPEMDAEQLAVLGRESFEHMSEIADMTTLADPEAMSAIFGGMMAVFNDLEYGEGKTCNCGTCDSMRTLMASFVRVMNADQG